ncbi:hypothetical protein IWW37_003694 [Coemansia sp. RSA 2050]|nr:hypothetical protein IWW37_003694 [Coemansia sp. RSA 2050]KAJ2736703.1 hypothetical protein IW152_000672 [Coemansia sp. BCRC 34962]
MEQADAEIARVFSVLQGRFAGHTIHHQQSLPSSPGIGGTEGSIGSDRQPKVWVIPAGVGSDLTQPVTLAALVAQWATLEESQKINAILGIAHVGLNKMRPVRSSVLELAELAKADTSDWVRVLGYTLGDVGVTGKMTPLEDLDSGSAVRAEVESGVEQVYSAVVAKLPELKLTTGVLSYVSPEVAMATAPPAIRNVYGDRPSAELLSQILASAEDKIRSEAETRATTGNSNTRRASAAPLNRASTPPSATDATGPVSAPMSRLGSPRPSGSATAAFSDLFGESDGDDMDASEPASVAPRMVLHVRSSHCADHVGRMKRLLDAALADTRRPSATDLAPRRGGGGGSGVSGVAPSGLTIPRRRRGPINTALPGAGLGTAAVARRGAEVGGGDGALPAPTRVMRKFNMEDAGEAMKERDRLMQAQKDKAAEEREAKRLKQQADAAERKRKREENAEKKRAAAEARQPSGRPGRPRGSTNRNRSRNASDDDQSGNESGRDSATAADDDDAKSPKRRSTRSSPVAARQNVYVPPEGYLTFAGNDPQIRAVYANTNALTDENRLYMYCFFNAYPSPPNAPQQLNIMLNEQVIDDPAHPGKTCTEIMVLEADFIEGTWSKKRRTRRT